MNKVISIALFGEGDKYARYLSAFVRGHLNLFPPSEGWELRIHVDAEVATGPLRPMLDRLFVDYLARPVQMEKAPLCKAMLWRMAPVFDTKRDVEWVFCRDIDAPPMPRDRACIDEFMTLGWVRKCVVHTIHDNLYHEGIMGGLCGFHAPSFREVTGISSLDELYEAAKLSDAEWAKHGADQIVLNRLLLRRDGPRLFEHRFNGWHAGPGKHSPRAAGQYPCAGVSAPVPDRLAPTHTMLADVVRMGDSLGNHLGCAGYDHEEAIRFWDQFGNPEIAERVRACEANK